MTIYCFDIDGTICVNTDGAYESAEPMPERIEKVNNLYDLGHQVILFTARGSQTGIDWSDVTKEQLRNWGVKYHQLLFGKPHADIFIDDKAINDNDWF
jgi:histidinol phosphatase-like enzyme